MESATSEPKSVKVGDTTILAISDGRSMQAASRIYPEAPQLLNEFRLEDGQFEMNYGVFVLFVDGNTVLVDAGNGPERDGLLMKELERASIKPEAVDLVVYTHLHGDHTGWSIDRTTGSAQFPNARYLVPEGDWRDYQSRDPAPRSFARDILPLESLGRLELFDGEQFLTPSLSTLPTPGHTRGHTAFLISSSGEHAALIGDAVISIIDIRYPQWITAYDWDKQLAVQTRIGLLARLQQESSVVGASHVVAPGLGRLAQANGGYNWEAL